MHFQNYNHENIRARIVGSKMLRENMFGTYTLSTANRNYGQNVPMWIQATHKIHRKKGFPIKKAKNNIIVILNLYNFGLE